MSYLSPEFALVFLIFLTLYWAMARWVKLQKTSLLLASYAIYASIDWRFSAILGAYSGFVLLVFAAIKRWPQARKSLAGMAIFASVANLAVFKYFDFFRNGMQFGLDFFAINQAIPVFDLLLPVGISFYTFQAIAYIVAVSRAEREPAPALESALYLVFFPTLFAGPICRPNGLLLQIEQTTARKITQADLIFWLFLSALVKKVWLATWLAEHWVNPLFANPDAYQGIELLFGMYAFAVQIYFDFSGYSDLVIAMAMLLGYQLKDNFNLPYLACSLREFWRRWHISLSSWIRDYVYIPMGGNQGSWFMTQILILSSMLLSGLWHGASLKFIIWGALHGVGMILQNTLEKITGRQISGFWGGFLTFHFVCLAWVFFRADGWQEALHYLSGLTRADGAIVMNVVGAGFLLSGFFILSYYSAAIRNLLVQVFAQTPWLLKPLILSVFVVVINLIGPAGVPAFLYYSY